MLFIDTTDIKFTHQLRIPVQRLVGTEYLPLGKDCAPNLASKQETEPETA
jgi:hypothetical protein